MKSVCLSNVSILMLSATLASFASTGCTDPPAADEAEVESSLRVSEQVSAPDKLAVSRSMPVINELADGPTGQQLLPVPAAGASAAAAGASAPAAATAAFTSCNLGPYALSATGSGLVVSAEFGYDGGDNGMLRARATAVGPWEKYDLCTDSGWWVLRATGSGRFVTAQVNYPGGDNGMLRASATVVGAWERFNILSTDGTLNGILFFQSVQSGLFVAAEFGYTGGHDDAMLRARTSGNALGPWEKFQLFHL